MDVSLTEEAKRAPQWAREYAYWKCMWVCVRNFLVYLLVSFLVLLLQKPLRSSGITDGFLFYILMWSGLLIIPICGATWVSYWEKILAAEHLGQEGAERESYAFRLSTKLGPLLVLGYGVVLIGEANAVRWFVSFGCYALAIGLLLLFPKTRHTLFR